MTDDFARDVGYHELKMAYHKLHDRYESLIEIATRVANHGCCICCNSCHSCDALLVLREIAKDDAKVADLLNDGSGKADA